MSLGNQTKQAQSVLGNRVHDSHHSSTTAETGKQDIAIPGGHFEVDIIRY